MGSDDLPDNPCSNTPPRGEAQENPDPETAAAPATKKKRHGMPGAKGGRGDRRGGGDSPAVHVPQGSVVPPGEGAADPHVLTVRVEELGRYLGLPVDAVSHERLQVIRATQHLSGACTEVASAGFHTLTAAFPMLRHPAGCWGIHERRGFGFRRYGT